MCLRLFQKYVPRRSTGFIRWGALLICGTSVTALTGGALVHGGSPWIQAEKIIGSDTRDHDQFGRAVALSEAYAVVGAPFHGEVGAAYLFDSMSGDELYQLVPQYGSAGDHFGFAVAINKDWIVVTAP